MTAATDTSTQLGARYRSVRDQTEGLASKLSAEDQAVQSMPDVSPTKWHRAHSTWFFETFVLVPHLPDYTPVEDHYGYLFNSYYEAVGARHPRRSRGLITRPTNDQVAQYRRRVDESIDELLDSPLGADPAIIELVDLGLHHEQQHQELLLMDIKHVLSHNPFSSAYDPQVATPASEPSVAGWVDYSGGVAEVGHGGAGFHFDNEGPRHEVLVHPHRLADRLVTNGEWLLFMADGAYQDAGLWLSDGWHTVQVQGWDAPLYWDRTDRGWMMHTLGGLRPVDPNEPVVHISFYEAEAFARWAGARLPTEFEWEVHAAAQPVEGKLLSDGTLHPVGATGDGIRQVFGDVWEWTSSAYAPYPGFRPTAGAVGEYNGKFMIDQQVLRGGSCITPEGHIRATYRNFFPASARWMFGGLRLASDASSAL